MFYREKSIDFSAKIEADLILENSGVSLSESDRDDIQSILDKLRTLISDASNIEGGHKRRLLLRLEKLQIEIHKSISDRDVALAAITEVSAAVGESGNLLKPIVDRFREIVGIVEKGGEDPLQLPAPPKQIEDHSEES